MLQSDFFNIFSDAQLNHSLYVEITPKVENCQHSTKNFLL
nr:MAG TPA: LIN-7, Peripheral plasma membrane protein, L27, alpha helix, scaffold [Caudoviricetes sp.]